MKYKKLLLCIVGILVLTPNLSLAVDKKLDRKQIYALRKKCGKSAAKYTKRLNLCGGKAKSYTKHYNLKLSACFVHISEVCPDDSYMEVLTDVDAQRDYSLFRMFGGSRIICYVGGRKCKNKDEYSELVKPYLTE